MVMALKNGQIISHWGKMLAAVLVLYYCAAQAYTPPITNRADINFNLGWKYFQGDVTGADTKAFGDAAWTTVCIPHSTKWVTPEDKTAYIGISWYRKHFTIDNSYQGRKAYVEFEAAMQYAEVWVNGTLKGTHAGGYMPFTFDISNDILYGGADNVIAVRTNSTPNAQWAPGNSNPDFQYFGGLYRDVNMYFTDNLHVTDAVYADKVGGGGIFVTYSTVGTGSATISIKTDVINENTASKSCTVVSDIVDAQGNIAQTSTATSSIDAGTDYTFSQSITLSNPKLWHPNTPNLYTLHTTIKDGSTPVDYCKTRIGIRSIQWTHGSGIVINGQGFRAMGSNMHQDIYGLGNAMPKRSIYYDVKRFKEGGYNFVRGSHYPHNTAFYDACDEFGVLVENCMTGWQYFADTDTFKNNTYKEVRDMIRRDRNHPCVAVWETQLNETSYTSSWATTVNTLAHAEYPTDQMFTCGTTIGWSLTGAVLWDVLIGATQASIRSTTSSLPIIISEYGNWDYGGYTSTSDVTRQSAEAPLLVQCDNIQDGLNKNRALSWYSADGNWVYGDYASYINSYYPANRLKGCGKVDYYRIPKFSYYFYQSQRDPALIIPNVNSGPMVYIANRWTSSSPTTVRVFSNCDQVSLYRDGALVATKSPDNNYSSLAHPPFTFAIGSFSAGMLRAVGLIGGAEKAADTVRTPGDATAVQLRPESTDSLEAGGSDARLVWIDVIDANRTVVSSSTAQVTLTVTGAGSIDGPTTVTMKGGQLATWVRSGSAAGTITVTASSTGLTSGTLTLVSSNTPTAVSGQGALNFPIKSLVPPRQAVFSLVNDKMVLPPGFSGNRTSVTVYDFSGRLLKNATIQGRTVNMHKDFNLSAGVYILRAQEIQETR